MNETILCDECEGLFLGIYNELITQAEKSKRSSVVKDTLIDFKISMKDGNIFQVGKRDRAYRNGKRIGRRLK